MVIKEIKYKDTIINMGDITITYTHTTNKECVGTIEDFGYDKYEEGYSEGYDEGYNEGYDEGYDEGYSYACDV